LSDTSGGAQATTPTKQTSTGRWKRFIAYGKGKFHQHRANKQNESPDDRAGRRTANATVWMAIFTVVLAAVSTLTLLVLKRQLKEMHDGGVDTHNLAVAAGDQANRMQDFANRMKDQADRTKDLADRMKDVADQTKDEADQTRDLVNAAKISADSARRAADIAEQTLNISERAYLTLGTPVDDFADKRTTVPIINSGHIPSGKAIVVTHEATFSVADSTAAFIPIDDTTIIERHWKPGTFETVPIGNPFNVEINFPAMVSQDFNAGKQGIVIAIEITYNDGFVNTPDQRWIFCDVSIYSTGMKRMVMRPCDNPTGLLLELATADKYPSPQYEQIGPN
jgi:hypothetical protein